MTFGFDLGGSLDERDRTASAIKSAVRPLYDRFVRQRVPRAPTISYDDVTTKKRRCLDLTTKFNDDERVECEALKELVEPGDHVLVIGGGFGVTTVVAARAAGPTGRVTTYEAVPEYATLTRWAVQHNHTPADVCVVEKVVAKMTAPARDQYGTPYPDAIAPDELPDADVWQLDCEGAEAEILDSHTPPQRAVIEVHSQRCDEQRVIDALPAHQRRDKSVDAPQWIAVITDDEKR